MCLQHNGVCLWVAYFNLLWARFAHFARRYKAKWQNLIRFSEPTNFPACDDCVAFKNIFEDSTEPYMKVFWCMMNHFSM